MADYYELSLDDYSKIGVMNSQTNPKSFKIVDILIPSDKYNLALGMYADRSLFGWKIPGVSSKIKERSKTSIRETGVSAPMYTSSGIRDPVDKNKAEQADAFNTLMNANNSVVESVNTRPLAPEPAPAQAPKPKPAPKSAQPAPKPAAASQPAPPVDEQPAQPAPKPAAASQPAPPVDEQPPFKGKTFADAFKYGLAVNAPNAGAVGKALHEGQGAKDTFSKALTNLLYQRGSPTIGMLGRGKSYRFGDALRSDARVKNILDGMGYTPSASKETVKETYL